MSKTHIGTPLAAVLQGERHRNVRLGYPQSMLETWPL